MYLLRKIISTMQCVWNLLFLFFIYVFVGVGFLGGWGGANFFFFFMVGMGECACWVVFFVVFS